MGRGTDNYVDIMALRTLLKLASNKGIQQLDVMGDTMLFIEWMRGENEIHNVGLQPLADKTKDTSQLFGPIIHITYTCTWELNIEVDASLSKEGLYIEFGF